MSVPFDVNAPCPCGSKLAAADCCWPLISGAQAAQTAEQLMRSRYSAYYSCQIDYLLKTQHPEFQEPDLRASLAHQFANPQGWIRLEVIKHQAKNDSAKVEFKAYFHDQQQVYCLHERSNFVLQQGAWFYTDGKILSNGPTTWPRNENCWCGSGKKHKRCPH